MCIRDRQIPGCKDAAEKQELIETNRKLRQRILELEEELRQTEADLKTLLLYTVSYTHLFTSLFL